jgi:hypothetical protein
MFGIRRSRLDCTRKVWALLAIVTVAEGLFNLVCCGFLTADWRAGLLFSDWMDKQKELHGHNACMRVQRHELTRD